MTGPGLALIETSSTVFVTGSRHLGAANPAVAGAITGFRRPAQVGPILAAADLGLTSQDIAEIEATN
jgi:hypothetical protein